MLPLPATTPSPSGTSLDVVTRWIEYPILNNPLLTWIIAAVFAVALFFGIRIVRRFIVERLRRSRDRVSTRLAHLPDKLLADIRSWCILAIAIYAASRILALPLAVSSALKLVFIVALSLQALLTSRLIIDFIITQALTRKTGDGQPDPSIASASGIIRFLSMLVLGALLVLLALANMGVEITPLITGLGVGGIAIALAAQSILGDLFGSLSILFDKPFLVGDFIVVGDQQGTVESIGVKTTRLRALSGEQLVFSNTDLLKSRIQNFKRMQERRAAFTVGVAYDTPVQKLERLPKILSEIVLANEKTRLDRAHFKSLAQASLEFEVVYYVLTADYQVYADIQQAVNFELIRRFAAEGIDFASPTQVRLPRPASA